MKKEKNNKTCRKCEKEFSKEEETVVIKGLVFKFKICKNCWKEIVNRCHSCEWPIYKNDLIYEISISRGAEYFVNASEVEKKIQCSSCYYDWLEKQRRKRWINLGLLTVLIFIIIWLLFITLPIFYPTLKDNWKKLSLCEQRTLKVLLFIIPLITIYLITQHFSSRYKIRERKA